MRVSTGGQSKYSPKGEYVLWEDEQLLTFKSPSGIKRLKWSEVQIPICISKFVEVQITDSIINL